MRSKAIVFFLMLILLIALNKRTSAEAHSDVELLANVMYLENGYTGKNDAENTVVLLYTGSVVLNRMESGEWGGKTMHDVIFAKGQYASSTKNNLYKKKIPNKVMKLAEMLMKYGSVLPKEVVYQSTQKNLGVVYQVIDGEYFASVNGKTGKSRIPDFIFKIIFERRNFKCLKKLQSLFRGA